MVAGHTAFIIGTAMTAIAAGRIELAFDLVHSHVITAVRHLTIGTIAILNRRLHLDLVGMAIVAERAFVAGGTEPLIGRSVKTMVFHKGR